MDKKLIGIVCASISMVSVVVFLILSFAVGLDTSWTWIVFVVAGVSCAIVSMIGNYTYNKKNGDLKEDKWLIAAQKGERFIIREKSIYSDYQDSPL